MCFVICGVTFSHSSQSLQLEQPQKKQQPPSLRESLCRILNTKHTADLLTRQAEVISLISAILSPDEEVAAHKAQSFIPSLCWALSCWWVEARSKIELGIVLGR